jgi:inorganic pyrophosphatase/exopolyphosphatase
MHVMMMLMCMQWLSGAVVGVIDHHEDTGTFATAPLRVVKDSVGSCSALVAQA